MTFDAPRVVEHVHGHLGWLAAALLAHPAVALTRPQTRPHAAVALAVLLPTAAGALGMWVYGPYRDRIKQGIFLEARWVGLLFERKEHLAFGAILLGWSAAAAYALSFRTDGESSERLRKLSMHGFFAAAALALLVAVLGTMVGSFRIV